MSKMIELHDIDVPGFLSVLDSCEGNVYLMTRDGDKLNLKSKLCQLIGLTSLIEGGKIAEAFVVCDNERMNPSCSALTFTRTKRKVSKE